MRGGKHWSHDGKILKIFNVYGCIHEGNLYLGESSTVMTQAMPHERASSAITGRLTNLDSGYGKKPQCVQYVQVNEYTAHLLFAEGFLNIDMLMAADEDEANIFFTLVLNSRRRIIAIRKDLTQALRFFGPTGRPLKIN